MEDTTKAGVMKDNCTRRVAFCARWRERERIAVCPSVVRAQAGRVVTSRPGGHRWRNPSALCRRSLPWSGQPNLKSLHVSAFSCPPTGAWTTVNRPSKGFKGPSWSRVVDHPLGAIVFTDPDSGRAAVHTLCTIGTLPVRERATMACCPGLCWRRLPITRGLGLSLDGGPLTAELHGGF